MARRSRWFGCCSRCPWLSSRTAPRVEEIDRAVRGYYREVNGGVVFETLSELRVESANVVYVYFQESFLGHEVVAGSHLKRTIRERRVPETSTCRSCSLRSGRRSGILLCGVLRIRYFRPTDRRLLGGGTERQNSHGPLYQRNEQKVAHGSIRIPSNSAILTESQKAKNSDNSTHQRSLAADSSSHAQTPTTQAGPQIALWTVIIIWLTEMELEVLHEDTIRQKASTAS